MQAREGGVLGRPKVLFQVEQLMWPAERQFPSDGPVMAEVEKKHHMLPGVFFCHVKVIVLEVWSGQGFKKTKERNAFLAGVF